MGEARNAAKSWRRIIRDVDDGLVTRSDRDSGVLAGPLVSTLTEHILV
jgi:hypothetical protein